MRGYNIMLALTYARKYMNNVLKIGLR